MSHTRARRCRRGTSSRRGWLASSASNRRRWGKGWADPRSTWPTLWSAEGIFLHVVASCVQHGVSMARGRGRPSRSAQYIPGRSARRRRGSSAPPERRTSRPCAQAVTSGLLASGGRSTRCDTPAHAPGVAVAPHESGHGRSSTPCGSARGIAPRCSPRSRHQDVVYRRTPRRKASANEIEGKC